MHVRGSRIFAVFLLFPKAFESAGLLIAGPGIISLASMCLREDKRYSEPASTDAFHQQYRLPHRPF